MIYYMMYISIDAVIIIYFIDGAVLVQLPSNADEMRREVRIGSQVNMTLDCGAHIDYERSRIPRTLLTNERTIWYHVEKDIDGNFLTTSTDKTVVDSPELDKSLPIYNYHLFQD